MRIKDLASAIGCTPGSASVAVKRMEKAALVKRRRSAKDERVVTVVLGPKGVKILDSWRRVQIDSMAALFGRLSQDEIETLRRLLEKALAGGDPRFQTAGSQRGSRG